MTILKEICSSLHGLHHLPVRLDNENNPATYRIKIKKMVERRIEGIIGVANSSLLVTKLFDTLKGHTMPIILIGRDMHGAQILSVTIDNKAGARLAIKHLYELGHRRIAFLCGPNDIIDNLQRWNGMTSFAAEACLQLDPKLSSHTKASCTSYDAGYLITFDDSTALIAIRALAVAERPVPAACSIVGFDDVMTSSYMNPPLTTVCRSSSTTRPNQD
jgi:LacI family transcriptional regulator